MEDSKSRRLTLTWSWSIGADRLKVTVYEHPTRKVLYLRWREGEDRRRNWRKESLGVPLRDESGRVRRDRETLARERARQKYRALGQPRDLEDDEPSEGLTIGEARALVIDPERGQYPKPSTHRAEVLRALDFAEQVWGKSRAWASIRKADLRALWRRRLEQLQRDGHTGARGAEVTVSRILTVAAWLRDEEHIPPGACVPPRHWKQVLREEAGNPDPHRPRYTVDEMRQLLGVSAQVSPRLALLVAIGAELRLGQVLRLYRHDVDLQAETVTVRGRGHKQGTVVQLTPGQLAAVKHALEHGYLRALERNAMDYPLFPRGKLRRAKDRVFEAKVDGDLRPIQRRRVLEWWRRAEELAGIPHLAGRGPYGVRRAAVDGFLALGISPKALENAGGWNDSQMPNKVYAARDLEFARREAAEKRAQLRGEVTPAPAPGAESGVEP